MRIFIRACVYIYARLMHVFWLTQSEQYCIHVLHHVRWYMLSVFCFLPYREYVQRAFEKCETESDKDQTEQFLKNMLTSAFRDGTAWVVDWDKEPLPRFGIYF